MESYCGSEETKEQEGNESMMSSPSAGKRRMDTDVVKL